VAEHSRWDRYCSVSDLANPVQTLERGRSRLGRNPNTFGIWSSRVHASFVTRSVSEENTAFLSLLAHASGYETDCFTIFQRYWVQRKIGGWPNLVNHRLKLSSCQTASGGPRRISHPSSIIDKSKNVTSGVVIAMKSRATL
jgi:hypothetical protein